MKKVFIWVLSIALLVNISNTSIFAHDLSKEMYDNYITQEQLDADRAEFEVIMKRGENVKKSELTRQASVSLNVPYLSQIDNRWRNTFLPCNHAVPSVPVDHTYGNIGCAMTSYAMSFRFLNSVYQNETPVTVATKYGAGACNFSSAGLLTHYPLVKVTTGTINNWTELENTIVGAALNNSPVVLRMQKGANRHFVVANGYYIYMSAPDDWYLTCVDPDPRLGFSTLNQAYNDGWSVNHAAVLSKK